jgi:hypothetical protein
MKEGGEGEGVREWWSDEGKRGERRGKRVMNRGKECGKVKRGGKE